MKPGAREFLEEMMDPIPEPEPDPNMERQRAASSDAGRGSHEPSNPDPYVNEDWEYRNLPARLRRRLRRQ